MKESRYYDEKEYLKAVKAYEKAEAEADKVKAEVFSFKLGELPRRSITREDIAVLDKAREAWETVLEIGRRPLGPKG